jgi:hypothetical protein
MSADFEMDQIYFERDKFIVFIVIMRSWKMKGVRTAAFYFREEDY